MKHYVYVRECFLRENMEIESNITRESIRKFSWEENRSRISNFFFNLSVNDEICKICCHFGQYWTNYADCLPLFFLALRRLLHL